ncbi:hypothetical protein SAMN05421507_12112 [Lentzea jiangxiensis]|uniref:Uncharacterized protein n=1 Tax=Lentzea jiangxiensis TaxID=641025 RepID=A0A1H0WPF2_9PSEU|nr:hypothetical protein SAMN05421507_12112 [Lentzea jiangxiensis]
MTTAPSSITAGIDSHSSTWLPSMITTLSPLPTPWRTSQRATRFERRRISSNEQARSSPSSSTMFT